MQARARAVVVGAHAFAAALAGVWAGGMITLGAVVAPIVFRTVPAPTSADAMTLVFRRFDRVALACAALLLVAEAVRAVAGGRAARLDLARAGLAVAGLGAALWEAVALAPKIEALHHAGAVRGLGALGRELDAVHRLAELAGRLEVSLALVVLVLHVVAAARRERA